MAARMMAIRPWVAEREPMQCEGQARGMGRRASCRGQGIWAGEGLLRLQGMLGRCVERCGYAMGCVELGSACGTVPLLGDGGAAGCEASGGEARATKGSSVSMAAFVSTGTTVSTVSSSRFLGLAMPIEFLRLPKPCWHAQHTACWSIANRAP